MCFVHSDGKRVGVERRAGGGFGGDPSAQGACSVRCGRGFDSPRDRVPGTPGDRKPIEGLTYERGMDPSENAAALLVSFFLFPYV